MTPRKTHDLLAQSKSRPVRQDLGRTHSGRAHFGHENLPHFGGLARIAGNQSGVAMIEYALIAALVALAIVAGMTQLGGGVSESWRAVDQAVGNVLGPFPTGNSAGNGNGNGGGVGNGNGNGNAGGNGNGNGNGDGSGNGNN